MRLILAVILFVLGGLNAFADIKGDWKFPSDIAAYEGKVYVVDGLNDRVLVYTEDGREVNEIRVPSPYGIYVNDKGIFLTSQKGYVYVVKDGEVKKFKVEGRPIDVVELDGKLYVTDGKTQSVDVYDLKGNLKKKFGSKGSAPGEFVGIFSIATDGHVLYVVDSINGRIQEFTPQGKFVRVFGVFGIEEGDLFRPKGVAILGKDVVVSDCITGAVQLFNKYGAFLKVIAKGVDYPIAVAADGEKVFVLEPRQGKVLTFRVQGVK